MTIQGKIDSELPVEAGSLSNKGTVLRYNLKCTYGSNTSSKIIILTL